jgi:phosphatidylglycerophosphate synthase
MTALVRRLPNLVSIARLVLGAWFVMLALDGRAGAAAALFLLAMATDVLDGWLARRHGAVTKAGIVLDAFADKAILVSGLALVAMRGDLPEWASAALFAYHAFTIVGLACTYLVTKRILEHALPAKAAGALHAAVVAAALLGLRRTFLGEALVFTAAGVSALALVYYLYAAKRLFKRDA